MITKKQIGQIKKCQKLCEMPDDEYRDFLKSNYNAGSCKDLTFEQAHDFITYLMRLGAIE